ncbi:MAG TPA: glycosyltransferase family 9 protein, partial [bacterium]|nr:glycosyltransferase family 9 protein [bacterium]
LVWTLFSGSPVRVGFTDQRQGHPSGKIYNLGVPLCPEDLQERDKNWKLVERLFPGMGKPPALRCPALPAGTERKVAAFYRSAGIGPRDRVLGLHPTLGKADNRWSQKKYLELLRRLSRKGGFKFVLVHGWGEGEALARFQAMAARVPGVTALPETDLFFILGAARRFAGLVCNDSGLMHALSLVTRVAAVFGPSEPSRWGPIGPHAHRIFRAADRRCDSVRPADVARYVQSRWRGRPS